MTRKSKLLATVLGLGALISSQAYADDAAKLSDLRANFRRVALEMASTEVQNAKYYSDNNQ